MGCKWRLLFLISPEVLSNRIPLDHLIFSLLLKCFVLSTATIPTLSNIEWNIHLLSSLNLMNRNFLPLSTNSLNTLIIKLFNFYSSSENIKSINSQNLWNGLIQSLYSPSWDPAEILSPVKRTFKSFNCRKSIFIIGSFPSSQEEISSFFTTNKNCSDIRKLSSLFLKEVLPPDLNKSLSSQCIRLIWINTNPNVSPISIRLQKSIKQITFFYIGLLYPSNSSTHLLPFLQFNDISAPFPVASTNSTHYPCILLLLDCINSIQARIHSFYFIYSMLTDDVCQRFLAKLDPNKSLRLPINNNSVFSVRVLAFMKSSIMDILNLFDLDLVSFITCPKLSQIANLNNDFLILISKEDGVSYLAFLRSDSHCVAYCFMVTERPVFLPKFVFLYKTVPIFGKSDIKVSHIKVDTNLEISLPVKEFVNFLLTPVYSLVNNLSKSFPPTSSIHQGDTDLLDWIENDLVVCQNTSLNELYLKTRPYPCDAVFQLIQLRSSMHTLNIESVRSKGLQIDTNNDNGRIDVCCKTLCELMSTIHDVKDFSDKAYSLLKSFNVKKDSKEIGGIFHNKLISTYVLRSLHQMKLEDCSIDERTTSVKKQVVIRFLLFSTFNICETNTTCRKYISEAVSLLRYLTISTSPAFVTDFMLNSLVKNCDLNLSLHKDFLGELYDSLGNQPPEVLEDLSFLHVSRDSLPDISPVLPYNCQLPPTPNEREDELIRHQSFHGLFADNSREISVINRNTSLKRSVSSTVGTLSRQQRSFKRTLFDTTEPKEDTHKGTCRSSIRNCPRSAGTPSKKVKILCDETPLKKRSSNRLLNTIRNEQKKCGIIPNNALVVLESPQRVFYSESSTLSWRQMPNDNSQLTPEKNNSVLSVFHSPLLAYRSVPLQHIESPFKLPFDPQSSRPVLEQEYDGFMFNSTPINNCIISPIINSNSKIDMFVTPTKYST